MSWLTQHAALSLIEQAARESWFHTVALGALSSKETLRATYDLSRAVLEAEISGDFVECGVYGGAQCAMMARALQFHGTFRTIHLFDTFSGVPEAGPNDTEWPHEPGISACSIEGVFAHFDEWMLPRKFFRLYPGLFSETIRRAIDEQQFNQGIALLRIDADLFESTKEALELEKLVNPGGWVIIDDWNLAGCRKACDEARLDTGPIYWRKQPV